MGDEIKIDGFEGTVKEIQARATIVNTYDERCVVIPNADLFTHSVIAALRVFAAFCEAFR